MNDMKAELCEKYGYKDSDFVKFFNDEYIKKQIEKQEMQYKANPLVYFAMISAGVAIIFLPASFVAFWVSVSFCIAIYVKRKSYLKTKLIYVPMVLNGIVLLRDIIIISIILLYWSAMFGLSFLEFFVKYVS